MVNRWHLECLPVGSTVFLSRLSHVSAEPRSQCLPFSLCFELLTAPLQVGVQRDPGLEDVLEQKQWVSSLAVEALLLTSLLGLHLVLSYSVLICAGPFWASGTPKQLLPLNVLQDPHPTPDLLTFPLLSPCVSIALVWP